MLSSVRNGYAGESEAYEEQAFSETPFADPTLREQQEPMRESYFGETYAGNWEFDTPFLPGESTEAEEFEAAPEVAEFSEMIGELKDTLFREALEQLADEALEAHGAQLAGEYGDRETRDLSSERLLNEHFEPLAAQAEAMLDRFFERLEGYEAESLTDMEIDRISSEVALTGIPVSPASEQFLGGLLRKAGKLVSGAVSIAKKGVKFAAKGLAAVGKLALKPLLAPLKAFGKKLLQYVVKHALNRLPPAARPLAQMLLDRLSGSVQPSHAQEFEAYEQTETEALPAARDAAQLEAEFDAHVAQLLFTSDQSEIEHLVSSYGESESSSSPLATLDNARSRLIQELYRLQPGENLEPLMEQFAPLLVWPAAKAITLIGRKPIVKLLGGLIAKLTKPLIGANASVLLGPAVADAGLRIFGLEASQLEPRAMLAEALAATIEETVNTVAALPAHILENETLLTDAVREAFENAASSNFPNSVIKSELRESTEQHGMWARMPAHSEQKRYAKYSDTLPVEIHPRQADKVKTFGDATLRDHLRDHHGLQEGRAFKGNVTLYQALPGTRASTIARAEGFPKAELHPLTHHAAGALLGQNAALGRHTPAPYLSGPDKLHVNQRLYRVHPPQGHHHHHHARRIHSELLINLLRGEIRLWLYLSEPLCQRISGELAKGNNAAAAFSRLKPLLTRTTEALNMATVHHHLPSEILVVGETPNLDGKVQEWLKHAGHHLGAKIGEWAQVQVAQYFRNSASDFKRACESHKDGMTLRITMTRVPGMEELRLLSRGKAPKEFSLAGLFKGSPAFQVIARPGYTINRLRD